MDIFALAVQVTSDVTKSHFWEFSGPRRFFITNFVHRTTAGNNRHALTGCGGESSIRVSTALSALVCSRYAWVNIKFSIIAVHGLNGDAYRTWTYKGKKDEEEGMLWLRDFLPCDIQDARVFSYGYDSRPAEMLGSASTKRVGHHAVTFLQDIYAKRVFLPFPSYSVIKSWPIVLAFRKVKSGLDL